MEPWTLFFTALGLAVFLEGLPYFLAPAGVRSALIRIAAWGDGALRSVGILLMISGLLVAYITLHWAY